MKIMAASDIHGSRRFCSQLVEAYKRERADKLLLLGDILKQGFSSGFGETGEDDVTSMLNNLSSSIVCVCGNGDWPINQQRFNFPCMDDYTLLRWGRYTIFATHGHRYNEHNLPPIPFDILLHGHTHVPAWREHEGYLYLNPGSVSLPRGGSKNGYLIMEENVFTWKDLAGNTLFCYSRPK
ncbi:MAG: phosphodiesterase [Clostridiales bacterium]|nr:phosphodiesterase [Clostridiales bacterium]